jgi:hypothetical protein
VTFYNPATATQVAFASCRTNFRLIYDDAAATMHLTNGEHAITIEVPVFALLGIKAGYLPEETLSAALAEASTRLTRIAELAAVVRNGDQSATLRFLDGTPILVTRGRLVADPVGLDYVVSGNRVAVADQEKAPLPIGSTGTPSFTTPCTCSEQRRVSAALRPRAELYSFDSESEGGVSQWLAVPAGVRHYLIFELTCPHASSRPSREDWAAAGWEIDACRRAWEKHPVEGPLETIRESTWLNEAVLVLGREVAAAVSAPDVASRLLRRLGFATGTRITAYAATANLLFATTEDQLDEATIRRAVDSRFFRFLDRMSRQSGTEVSFLTRLRVGTVAPLEVPVASIALEELVGG